MSKEGEKAVLSKFQRVLANKTKLGYTSFYVRGEAERRV